jgi:hypothetical protein
MRGQISAITANKERATAGTYHEASMERRVILKRMKSKNRLRKQPYGVAQDKNCERQ